MTLNELKLSAKRLSKHGAELFGASAKDLSHSEALELIARLHGFRDYHEAQQRLSQRELLGELLQEPGGMLSTQGITLNMASQILLTKGIINVTGPTGSGKSILCNELVAQAMALGRPVRILDNGGSYRRLNQMLQGEYYAGPPSAEAYTAWESSAKLVTLEMDYAEHPIAFDFKKLHALPPNALVLCDECQTFRHVYKPLNAKTCVLIGQHLGEFPEISEQRLIFSHKNNSQSLWLWQAKGTQIELRLQVGPLRMAAYARC